MTKRAIQKENTRAKILKAGYKVYGEKGFAATTSDLAKEAKISHGLIFAYFPTVEDLLISLIEDFGKLIGEKSHSLSASKNDISQFLNIHLDILEKHENFYCKIISEMMALPEEARNTFMAVQSMIAFHFSQIIADIRDKKVIKNIPDHMLFNTWVALIHYYLQNNEFFAPNGSLIKNFRQILIDNFLSLIKQ